VQQLPLEESNKLPASLPRGPLTVVMCAWPKISNYSGHVASNDMRKWPLWVSNFISSELSLGKTSRSIVYSVSRLLKHSEVHCAMKVLNQVSE
jgi:hypothetical protein